MMKDCIEPLFETVDGESMIPAHESQNGPCTFQNGRNHAEGDQNSRPPVILTPIKGNCKPPPRSSHKIVTPLRRQNTSFLVASLESLFSDSQQVSDQIAKFTNPNSSYKSPATKLANSFSFLSTDNLTDPSLLQYHVQKSLESSSRSSFDLESSPYHSTSLMNSTNNKQSNAANPNSLYNTPIRCKQSRSHDFSELPSQQRARHRRRSSIVEEDLLSSFGGALSDLSHFKDSGADEIDASVITNACSDMGMSSNSLSLFECDEQFTEEKRAKLSKEVSRTYSLPSTEEYQDGSKPPFSYASLIAQAILAAPKQRLALNNIYTWIMDTYPYYHAQTCGWQNSIRHNLSLNKCFKKFPRDDDEPGKGAYWTVDYDEMDDFEDGMFKRRRTSSSSNSNSSNNSNSNSTCTSQTASCTDTPRGKPSNNAFLNGTGWSPLIGNATPNSKITNNAFRTPQATKRSQEGFHYDVSASVPMTPLTIDSVTNNQFETPKKRNIPSSIAVVTPKLGTNSVNRSPYFSAASSASTSTAYRNMTDGPTATFWSYPNLTLSQMGLNGEPPECSRINSVNFLEQQEPQAYEQQDQNQNIQYNLPNSQIQMQNNKIPIPELFQTSSSNATLYYSSSDKDASLRLSPLSWLLNVSSQDSSFGLFDQSQQILSEYLSFNTNF